jgi:hypothetical protein
MKLSRIGATAAVAAMIGGAVAASGPGGASAASAAPSPGSFHHPQQNAYFPLVPGTVSRYRGTDEGERFRERVVVTHRTKVVDGVRTTVVVDVLRRADGTLAEKTHDWYAADHEGNVWYFGEATATYDDRGHLEDTEGSWQAGVDGAVAGVVMPADPRPTDAYRQELYPGHAEDQAWITQRHATTTVPYGRLHQVVRSFEWSRLEKRVVSLKLYAPGIGIVRERDLAGGSESFALVAVRHRG